MNVKVQEDLNKHIRVKQDKGIKQKPETNLTPDNRLKAVQENFANNARKIGFAPITKEKLDNVMQNMIRRGVISNKESYQLRLQRTIKSYIKTWAMSNLKMTDEDWQSFQVEKIVQNPTEAGDIVFLTCQSSEDIGKITMHARNLPQDGNTNTPRLVMYVDPKSRARYQAIQTIAKTIRDQSNNTVQTSVCTGKNDFLLRKKNQG